MTLKMGVALEFAFQLDNHRPQPSDFDIACEANDGT